MQRSIQWLVLAMWAAACGDSQNLPLDASPNTPDAAVDGSPNTSPDASRDAAQDATEPMMSLAPPPVDVATPEIVDGTSSMDEPILALTRARYEDVTVENAAAHTTRLTEAEAAMRASSVASANRLAESCSSIPIDDVARTADCHYALSLVASPASLALLASHAMAPITAPAADEHVSGPSAARLARQTAIDALADHARFGNEDARNVLVDVVREGDELTRAIASRAILLSFPRRDAKAALRDALPASEHWRIYEVRQ